MRFSNALLVSVVAVAVAQVHAQQTIDSAKAASGHACAVLTQANANASAGTVNIQHDGTPIAGTPAPDISKGFGGIPRSAQPPLTASQQRIRECTYRLAEANADMAYTLFVPSTYDPQKPAPLVVDLHGLNITPLQQILFDGTTDFAERYGFIVLMHGAKDSIVPLATSRAAAAALQAVGAPHLYLEFPDKDHEFWIRRGAAQMEKVFLFFSLVSKRTTYRN
jgi:acetyl esterase/lipase